MIGQWAKGIGLVVFCHALTVVDAKRFDAFLTETTVPLMGDAEDTPPPLPPRPPTVFTYRPTRRTLSPETTLLSSKSLLPFVSQLST